MRFGKFELLTHERRLLIDGAPATLGARAIDLLLALAERPGELVSKRALMDLVWPGLVVTENNLAAQVSALRKLVGGDVVATIPGRGYRFIAHFEAPAPGAPPPAVPPAGDRIDTDDELPAVAGALRTNLPVELPALLGRADELAALGKLIDQHRLVSVVGMGGMGKSLLVQHLLEVRRNAYPHGVCWVELAEVDDAAALPGAIAAALGVHIGHGEALSALVAAVTPLTMLLALDNAEHHLAAVAHVCQALHDAAPGVRLVVTTQAPLGCAVERVFRIEPLAVPDTASSARQAREFGAVALFIERAQSSDSRFALTDANAATVIDLCRELDGVPLAIELAAARLRTLGMARLLASMQERLKLLTTNRNRAAPVRQQTLRAALEWSFGLLEPREQQVFRRLGVIAGSASLAFIQRMFADVEPDGGLDEWAVLDAMEVLVERSLVAVLATEGETEPRYRLLEAPRAFALEQLDLAGERQAMQHRHASSVGALFEAAYRDYFSARTRVDGWLHRLAPDFDNGREALAWARVSGDAALELTICVTLMRALPYSLHAELMTLADACERRIGAQIPAALQLRTWLELSSVWSDTQKQRSRSAANEALRLARTLADAQQDRFPLYYALARAANAAAQDGDVPAAGALLDELRAIENPAWPAQRLLWGAEAAQAIARISGDRAEALRRSRRLLALDQARGGDASVPLGNLIDAELAAGDAAGAARAGAAFVASLVGTRHEYTLAYARINLCAALLAMDDHEHARPVAQAVWPQAIAFEVQHYGALYLALLAALESRPRAAAQLLGYAEAIFIARKETPETNEAVAMTRVATLVREQLDDAAFAGMRRDGASLRDDEIAPIAFATGDA